MIKTLFEKYYSLNAKKLYKLKINWLEHELFIVKAFQV